jgi:hypothetical protein
MSDSNAARHVAVVRGLLERPGVGLLALVVFAELALLAGYVGVYGATVTSVRYLLYPFVWINLGLWGVFAVTPEGPVSTRARRLGLGAAAAYLGVLAVVGGVVSTSLFGGHVHATGVDVAVFTAAPPGWAPTVILESPTTTVTLVPYKIVGYLGLTYLTYVAVVDATATALSGAVGLLSCASCSWPVFASLLAAVAGSEAVASTLYAHTLDLSTIAFVLAVALLVYRPGGD